MSQHHLLLGHLKKVPNAYQEMIPSLIPIRPLSDLCDPLLHGASGDEAVDHHLVGLADAMGTAEGLQWWSRALVSDYTEPALKGSPSPPHPQRETPPPPRREAPPPHHPQREAPPLTTLKGIPTPPHPQREAPPLTTLKGKPRPLPSTCMSL